MTTLVERVGLSESHLPAGCRAHYLVLNSHIVHHKGTKYFLLSLGQNIFTMPFLAAHALALVHPCPDIVYLRERDNFCGRLSRADGSIKYT